MISAEQGQIVEVCQLRLSIQSRMWCRSHQLGGWVHRGNCPSGVSGDGVPSFGRGRRAVGFCLRQSGTLLRLMMVGQISASSAIRSN